MARPVILIRVNEEDIEEVINFLFELNYLYDPFDSIIR